MVTVLDVLGFCLDGQPVTRPLWRKIWERRMEVKILPPQKLLSGDAREQSENLELGIEGSVGVFKPWIAGHFGLQFTNHLENRRHRIRLVRLELKKRRLYFWHKTLCSVDVYERLGDQSVPKLEDIDLEPFGRVEKECEVLANLDGSVPSTIPRISEAWIILEMYGLPRKREVILHRFDRRLPSPK